MAFRASPFLRRADRESLDAESQPEGQGNHVVGRGNVFRGRSNAERVLRLGGASSRQQGVADLCNLLGDGNAVQQLEKQRGRLFQGASRTPFVVNCGLAETRLVSSRACPP